MTESGWVNGPRVGAGPVRRQRLEGGARGCDRTRRRSPDLHRVPVRGAHPARRLAGSRRSTDRSAKSSTSASRSSSRTAMWRPSRRCASRSSRRTASTARDPKMSFFMYTDGRRAGAANLVFGAPPETGRPARASGRWSLHPPTCPRSGTQEFFDLGTSGPSRNFVYDMEAYRFFVRDEWEEILAHDAAGTVTGRLVRGPGGGPGRRPRDQGRDSRPGRRARIAGHVAGAARNVHPRRVWLHPCSSGSLRDTDPPAGPDCRRTFPIRYGSGNWDVAWIFLRTDGQATVRRLDPWTRVWEDRPTRFACRWFAR